MLLTVNVILQDIFYEVYLGALRAAILYQILILVILWMNKKKLITSIKALLSSTKLEQSKFKFLSKLLIAFAIFIVLRILEYYITIKW